MTLEDVKSQAMTLTPAEQTALVQWLVQHLSRAWPGIEKTPGVVSGDACIAGTRIPVWDLVQSRRLGASEAKLLEAYPQLTATDLAQAWQYAVANPDEIEAAIQQDEAA